MHAHNFLFLSLHSATVFATIQHDVFSKTVLSILRHFRFMEASFEPVTSLPMFHPFVLNWPLQEQVHFGS